MKESEDPAKKPRKPRADSLRNRERLLEAARAVFSAGGPEASLEAVARTAGFGIGTLYRHFPTREALFQAVYRREVDELTALAVSLSRECAPVEALRLWLRASVRMVATKKGMLAVIAPTPGSADDLYADAHERLLQATGRLVSRARDAGLIRDDVPPDDVLRALMGFCYTREQPDWQAVVLRLLDVFVDGLRLTPSPEGGRQGV